MLLEAYKKKNGSGSCVHISEASLFVHHHNNRVSDTGGRENKHSRETKEKKKDRALERERKGQLFDDSLLQDISKLEDLESSS